MRGFLRALVALVALAAPGLAHAQLSGINFYNGNTYLGRASTYKADGTTLTCSIASGIVTCSANGGTASGLIASNAYGTIQYGIVSSDAATYMETEQWTSGGDTIAGLLNWYDTTASFTNVGSTAPNTVKRFGWNVAGGGGRVNGSYPAYALEFENHYQPGSTAQFENHFAVYGLDGGTYRPWSVLATWHTTPHITVLIEGNEVGGEGGVSISGLPGPGGGTVSVVSTQAQLTSPAGNIIVANTSGCWLYNNGFPQRIVVLAGDGIYIGGSIRLDSDTQTMGGAASRLARLYVKALDDGNGGGFSFDTGGNSGTYATLDFQGLVINGSVNGQPTGGGGLTLNAGSGLPVGPAGMARFRYNESTGKAQVSLNGAAYVDISTGGSGVSSVSNSDSTLTISPTTGAVVASINLANSDTWTAQHTWQLATAASATIAISLQTTTAATSGNQKYSPALDLLGNGWDSTASASKSFRIKILTRPVQQAGNPIGDLVFYYNTNGGGDTEYASIRWNGSYPQFTGTGTVALYNTSTTGVYADASSVNFLTGGSTRVDVTSSGIAPFTDNTYTSGDSTHRWSTLYAITHNSGATSTTITNSVTDSASAVGTIIDTTNNFTTLGDKLVSVRTATVEQMSIRPQLVLGSPTGVRIYGDANTFIELSNGAGMQACYLTDCFASHIAVAAPEVIVGGVSTWNFAGGSFVPSADNTRTAGTASIRIATLYAFNLLAGNAAATATTGTALAVTGQAGGAASGIGPVGGTGGALNLTSGAGGAQTSGGTAGNGGAVALTGGAGGAANAGGPGAGGGITLTGGAGGANSSTTTGTQLVSTGGRVTIIGGAGGNGGGANLGGNGGDVYIDPGAVGTNGASNGTIKIATVNGAAITIGAVNGTTVNFNQTNITLTTVSMAPSADGNSNLGDSTHRWSDVATQQVSYGSGTLFTNLGTPANGTTTYCSDCTIANPCAGSGTGAIAKRLNGAWVCN